MFFLSSNHITFFVFMHILENCHEGAYFSMSYMQDFRLSNCDYLDVPFQRDHMVMENIPIHLQIWTANWHDMIYYWTDMIYYLHHMQLFIQSICIICNYLYNLFASYAEVINMLIFITLTPYINMAFPALLHLKNICQNLLKLFFFQKDHKQ